jgi:hypothetical protein
MTMTSTLVTNHPPTLVLHLEGERRPSALVPHRSVALLYGLSLAVVLPPGAWLPPPEYALPTIHPTAGPVLDLVAMATDLGQSVTELGCARIALGEVDRRLPGLSLSLDLFQVGDGRGALLASGVVRRDGTSAEAGGATLTDLWALAREAVPRYGLVWSCDPGAGADAILVRYGSATVQAAWLSADYLATVSTTGLHDDHGQTIETVHTVARLLASRLESPAQSR